MPDEYTPTTSEVRAVWREWNNYGGLIDRTCPEPITRAGMVAEFDRWINEVKAEAWDEGYDYATNGKWGPGENPYEGGNPAGP